MSSYSHTLTLTLPYTEQLSAIASSIARAMDPDTGGADSFHRCIIGFNDETPIYGDDLICITPCTQEFHEQAMQILSNPELLFQVTQQDYQNRWPDLTAPTLEDCVLFVQSLK